MVRSRPSTSKGNYGDSSRDSRNNANWGYKKRKEGGGKGHIPKKKFKRGQNFNKSDRRPDKQGRKDDKSSAEKGEKSSHNIAAPPAQPSFMYAWLSGLFSVLSISMISKAGLSLNAAVQSTSRPIGGRIASCYDNWRRITNNNWILDILRHGYKLQFSGPLPPTPHRVPNLPTNADGTAILDYEVEQMLKKTAIHAVESSDDELTSCFFARPKKTPGKWRPIVSLKFLNKFLRYIKFKMTTIADVKLWIRK